MSERKNININPDQDKKIEVPDPNIAAPSDVSSVAGSVKHLKHATSSERQIKFERAQKCLENAALVSKRIKEHRKATAELLGRPFEEDVGDTASEVATTISERTGYSAATDTSATLSVQDALNIPGISESLANTLKQKELLMERIKQYKEISKRPMKKPVQIARKDSVNETLDLRKSSENADISKLVNTIKEKDNNLSVMQVKMRAMETTILDLQEKINEKDQIIEAKNRATTLISDSLSKKEKETLGKLEDTKEQMIKMQNNFIIMETEWKEEKQKLINEIEEKNDKINSLKEANTILENARFEITMAHSKLADELELKTKEVLELQEKINKLSDHSINPLIADKDQEEEEEEKGSIEVNNMEELSKKIELLEQINFEIRQTNKELENQLATINQEPKSSVSPNKRGSPLPSRKTGRGSKMKSPWSNLSSESLQETDKKVKTDKNKSDMVQALNKEILQKEYLIAQKDMLITKLQSNIDKKEAIISELELSIKNQKQLVETSDIATSAELEPPTIDKQDIECQNIEELQDKLNTAQAQIITLNDEIEAANKNMIKVKSNFKLKMKQMQKTIDNFSKVSDANAEIIKLNEEIQQLTQKVAELEEEKGNLQLHLVDYDSGRLTESDIYKKLVEMENLSEARLKSITLLETQKFDLVQELHSVQQRNLEMEDKLADISLLQNEQVCSEMKSVQLEEQIDKLQASKNELELIIENLNLDKEQLSGAIKLHQEEKEELIQKLDNYIQENIELTDKLEKLSAEKVSSAESIEIVESLTTQEKLELEEYNKSLQSDNKIEGSQTELTSQGEEPEMQNEKLIEEAIQLKKKIELFSCERQEVMEKMNKLSLENESLNENIRELAEQCNNLKNTIDQLNDEKIKLISVNEDLNHQIDELKQEKSEILKETAEAIKPLNTEDVTDGSTTDSIHHDDKSADKNANRTKSVKQLTKEILKLKNTIKEREDEIADCQMKILSLEEQQDKQKEILQKNASNEKLIKKLTDENNQLKNHIDTITNENRAEQNLHISQAELIQVEIQKVHQEYTTAISARDNRIHELENVLVEYEKQVINYSNTLQQKDKELSEYINQITKLNDVTQKLKSTVDLLEEEKAKDQNGELIKSLNKQIALYQKTLSDYEEKLRVLEDEKAQLITIKSKQENKNNGLEAELKKLQELFTEKQDLLTELQNQQQKQHDERSALLQEAKERDEEIHEIKLQLRKESIDNEKLHNIVVQKSSEFNELTKLFEDAKEKLNTVSDNKNVHDERYIALENKNKELMEKLKKYAINFKKKANMYSELENQYNEVQKQLDNKNEQYDQLLIQVDTIPALQEKLKHAEEEFNRLQSQKIIIEQKSQEILHLQSQIETLKKQVINDNQKNIQLNESIDLLNKDLYLARDQNKNLENQTETLNKKIVEYEIEQRNNANILTKISCLEAEVNQKQEQMSELSNQLEIQKEKLMQVQFGHDAKVQESDMYIESLQSEIDKYKNRIYRLEESISTMENRRQSLERKADSLDIQLHEKQKAYDEYNHQEDELVNRLAVLIDNDRVVEKQITEIESENKELRFKFQNVNDEIQNLQRSYFDLQTKCDILEDKAKKADSADSEIIMYQNTIRELEANLKRVTNEHSTLFAQKKAAIEELELEFNTQIESAIKEKKILSEKYEKICDHTSQLEMKLNEYRNTIETLNLNLSDLAAQNQALINKANIAQKEVTPDYTEQYISEINKLNSILNSKNTEITDLNDKIQKLQQSNLSNMSNLESKNSDLINKVDSTSIIINNLTAELQTLKQNNEQLQILMNQKDEQIKQIVENKKLNFEMNIPKTEGMTISSTIEAVDLEPKPFDISYLQSQIISDTDFPTTESQEQHISKKISEIEVKQPLQTIMPSGVIEETIVPKKSYVCYKQDVESEGVDPFNSDEGWGLEAGEESEEVTPGFAHLNQQIEQLNETNQKLKLELDTTNAKLLKALKKLKELKATNDMLSKELQLTKTISQSSMLDMAIESELSSNLEVLEKKIQELNTDLSKEKREKEYLKKQNEVFKNANDRLTEMKEKMDSELQMWKYNFKQVNDKVSSLQWGGESNDTVDASRSQHAPVECSRVSTSRVEEDMKKLEKENDELQTTVENLNEQNIQLSKEVEQLKIELSNLKQELHQRQESCNNCKNVKELHQKLLEEKENLQLENNNLKVELKQEKLCLKCESLKQKIDELVTKISSLEECNKEISENTNQLEDRHKQLINENENLQFKIQENQTLYKLSEENLQLKNNELLAEIDSLKISENEANLKIVSLSNELQETVKLFAEKEKAETANNVNAFAIAEKYQNIEEISLNLKNSIDEANLKIYELEEQNKIITESNSQYEKQIFDLNEKLRNLNTENDQLLSTVTELRSSVSSAMDQRGFEIAELWKQHLAQRECEFQQIEQDLRSQMNASEAKYEQLLEKVQSSDQAETNKIILAEQISSLQNKLQEKEEHLTSLRDKYTEVINQLDLLRSEMEDEKLIHENKILVHQEEYEKVIQELNKNNKEQCDELESAMKNLQTELEATKTVNTTLNLEADDLRNNYENKMSELIKQLQIKDSEIFQKTHDYTISLTQGNEEFENVRKQLIEYEKKVEDLTFEKESELAILRLKMHGQTESFDKKQKEVENEKNNVSESLKEKIIECTNLNKQIMDLNKVLEEYANRATETQEVLENQELEIVTLKDEVASLKDSLRAASSKIEKHVTFASGTKLGPDGETTSVGLDKELLDAVPRAELDLALYMLHQRDVRCEELTMELTQLLEERDTLQLRLSDSLRSFEELKSRCSSAGFDLSINASHEGTAELPSFTVEKEHQFVDTHKPHTSRSSSVSDPDADKPKLQAKLSELRTVRHSRDVVLRHESEQRQLGMRLLQRDVANLPPEAVEQLTQAHHTLSRDTQSTPTVLLNWLRGKSTPKVVHM